MQSGQWTVLLDHTETTARLEVRSTDESPLRQQWRMAPRGQQPWQHDEHDTQLGYLTREFRGCVRVTMVVTHHRRVVVLLSLSGLEYSGEIKQKL